MIRFLRRKFSEWFYRPKAKPLTPATVASAILQAPVKAASVVAEGVAAAPAAIVQAAKPAAVAFREDHYVGGRYDQQSVVSFKAAERKYDHVAKDAIAKQRQESGWTESGVYFPPGWGRD